jgi:hypothetical protein
MKCEDCKKDVKEVWPKKGDYGWWIDEYGDIIRFQVDIEEPYLLGFYKTREDAEVMRNWYLAQQLDWMSEEIEKWWYWDGWYWDGFDEEIDVEESPSDQNILMGNIHKTNKDARAYGKLMQKAAEIKLKYYKLKHGL